MTDFEIAMLLALFACSAIFGIVCAGLFSRTRRNKLGIDAINDRMDAHVRMTWSSFRTLSKEISINKEETNKNEETNDWKNIYYGIKIILNNAYGSGTSYAMLDKLCEIRNIAKKHVDNAEDS